MSTINHLSHSQARSLIMSKITLQTLHQASPVLGFASKSQLVILAKTPMAPLCQSQTLRPSLFNLTLSALIQLVNSLLQEQNCILLTVSLQHEPKAILS